MMRTLIGVMLTVTALQAMAAADWNSGVTYSYDGSGNIRQIGTDHYVYDATGRLVQADTNGVRRNYEYDAFGNRKICSQPGTDCQWGYKIGGGDNRIVDAEYTPAGNLKTFAGHTYSYDATNMLTRDASAAGIREYIYTADDERIAVYTVNTGSWRWTLRDTSGRVLREFTSQNGGPWNWVKDYIWRDNLLLATRQIEPGATTPTTYHYHLDHLGSPRQITDDANRIVGTHHYHPFGPEQAQNQQNEPSRTLLKYTAHERDLVGATEGVDTLDYMHARYYSPALGRFLSVDPAWSSADLRRPQSWNRYTYVLNNPSSLVDPDGKNPLWWVLKFLIEDLAAEAAKEARHVVAQSGYDYLRQREPNSTYAKPVVAPPNALEPGTWISTNETMSERAASYQRQVGGMSGAAYLVNGVKFDSYRDNKLIEAKGPGYDTFVHNGRFLSFFNGADALLDQARRQVLAAQGIAILWHVAEEGAARAIRDLFQRNGINGIQVIYTPPE